MKSGMRISVRLPMIILNIGVRKIRVTTVGDGPHPQPTVVGDTVHVGKRIVSFADKGLKIE